MEIHQSLTKSKIRTILPRHEQGGSFAAEGYARVTGKAGVCMGTSGPARRISSPPSPMPTWIPVRSSPSPAR